MNFVISRFILQLAQSTNVIYSELESLRGYKNIQKKLEALMSNRAII